MANKHIIMGDTDSCYCRLDLYAEMHDVQQTEDNMVLLADALQSELQASLPDIISAKFITTPERISILEPGREVVARSGLFKHKKKRYALYVVDDEHKKVDKLKIMGMETKRSDTPKFIQDFLTKCLVMTVKEHKPYEDIYEYVNEFRKEFRNIPAWKKGSPGRVKNLKLKSQELYEWINNPIVGSKKTQMHFTVKAANNTNMLIDLYGEHRMGKIRDGDKIQVIYLKDHPDSIDCVALPTDDIYIPEWFKELPFDVDTMEQKLLDKKLFNVIGDVMKWDFSPKINYAHEITEDMDDFYD